MSTSFSRRERNKRGAERAVKRRVTLVQRAARAPLTDCCATTSAEGHKGATEGTFGMFSSPMTGEEFLKKINA